jgi:hypothetical protein
LHFFVDADDRRDYVRTLHKALAPGGYAISSQLCAHRT